MSISKILLDKFNNFLKTTRIGYLRYADNEFKQRKYKNIAIQNEFDKLEHYRKTRTLFLEKFKKEKEAERLEKISKLDNILKSISSELNNNQYIDSKDKEKYQKILKDNNHESIADIVKSEALKKLTSHKELTSFISNNSGALFEKKESDNIANKYIKDNYDKEITQLKSDIDNLEKELQEFKSEFADLKQDSIILDTFNRDIVLCRIKYLFLQSRDFECFDIHPEDVAALEDLNYKLQNNLPVEKLELFRLVPEYFEFEIDDLNKAQKDYINKNRFKLLQKSTGQLGFFSNPTIYLEAEDNKDFYSKLRRKEYDMTNYFLNEAAKFSDKYDEVVNLRSKEIGLSIYEYFEYLSYKRPEELGYTDKEVKLAAEKVHGIYDDFLKMVDMNEDILAEYKEMTSIPDFIQGDEKLIAIWNHHAELMDKNTYEMVDTQLVPDNYVPKESPIDTKIKEMAGVDVEELNKMDKNDYYENLERLIKKYENLGIQAGDKIEEEQHAFKESQDMKRSKMLGEALNGIYDSGIIDEYNEINYEGNEDVAIDHTKNSLFTKGLKHIKGYYIFEELNKALYLNNSDPKYYNIKFFSEYFSIPETELLNIFRFYSLPLIDYELNEHGILRFIFTD